MSKRDEIELELHPDQNLLDEEWVNQPRLRFRWGCKFADARKELAEAKASLEVEESELKQSIRNNPGLFGVKKPTEDAIKTAVPLQESYKDAKRAVIDAQHRLDVIEAAVAAIDHRKKALEDLVQLWLSNYFSTPRAPEVARERMEDVEKGAVRRRGRREET